MKNRIWIPFFVFDIIFLALKWFVFPSGDENHDFVSYMANFCSILVVVFGILNMMGHRENE